MKRYWLSWLRPRHHAAIGFGSNMGDRQAHLNRGLEALAARQGLVAVSSLYETAPIGPVPQQDFLNAVAVIKTRTHPDTLLDLLHSIEDDAGRVREENWGARTLDLDLLLYEGVEIHGHRHLTLPHPELHKRRFVLEPLLEAWPEALLPDGEPIAPLLDAVADQQVRLIGSWDVDLARHSW